MDFMLTLNLVVLLGVLATLAAIALKLRARFRHLDAQLANLTSSVGNPIVARFEEKTKEIQHAVALTQMGFRFPVFLSGWSIDAFLGKFLVEHLHTERPRMILELGSGSSTVLIARCLELVGDTDCQHFAVDHEARFLDATRRQLEFNGLADKVTLWHCPLGAVPGTDRLWYQGLQQRLAGRKVDLLLVDGPPGPMQDDARLPAMPLLLPYLSDRCVVVLDDARRADERAIAESWARTFPEFTLDIQGQGHGIAVLRRTRKTSAAQATHGKSTLEVNVQ